MTHYEYEFSTILHEKLKELVIGKVYVRITPDDKVYVNIKSFDDIEYVYLMGDFTYNFLRGLSATRLAQVIVAEYKKFVINKMTSKYFK